MVFPGDYHAPKVPMGLQWVHISVQHVQPMGVSEAARRQHSERTTTTPRKATVNTRVARKDVLWNAGRNPTCYLSYCGTQIEHRRVRPDSPFVVFFGKPSATPFSLNPHEQYHGCQSNINKLPVLCSLFFACLQPVASLSHC